MAEQHKLAEIIEDEAITKATTKIWSGSESDNDRCFQFKQFGEDYIKSPEVL